jgi:hypothetical protein
MDTKFGFSVLDTPRLILPPNLNIRQSGCFDVRCFNPDGSLAWQDRWNNGATSAALNDILSVYFAAGTPKTTWYIGLINNAGFSALASADTMASHAGWTELTDYSESVRQTWTPSAPAGGSVTNTNTPSFTNITNGNVVNGAFLVSDNTKGGTTGVLWATSSNSTPQTLQSGQVLKVNYTNQLQ